MRDRLPGWATFGLIRLAFWVLTALTVLWYPEHGSGVPAFTAWGKASSLFFGTFEHGDADYCPQIAKGEYDIRNPAFIPAFPLLVYVLVLTTGSGWSPASSSPSPRRSPASPTPAGSR